MNRSQLLLLCGLTAGILLVACGGGSGGGDSGGGGFKPAVPVVTSVGKANGDAASATIGAAGGNLASADGKVTLKIPPDALSEDTSITIQPISNYAHGKNGSAYRLTPEGLTFKVPVTLTFPYTDDDLVGTAADALGVVFQTSTGFWQWTDDPVIDTTAKTVSVSTTHFSDWSMVHAFQLRPPSATVETGASLPLRVAFCYLPIPINGYNHNDNASPGLGYECDQPNMNDGDYMPFFPPSAIKSWMVNSIAGGNATVGTVVGNNTGAIYTAPSSKPTPNNVAVSAELASKTGEKILLVSSITIQGDVRNLRVTHSGVWFVTDSIGATEWENVTDEFTLTIPSVPVIGEVTYPIPASWNLKNVDSVAGPLRWIYSSSCPPPIADDPIELITVNEIEMQRNFDGSLEGITFRGTQHIPALTIPVCDNAPPGSWPSQNTSSYDFYFGISADAWNKSATEKVTITKSTRDSGTWTLEIGP